MKPCVTGVDIGTGSTKAITISSEGKVIATSQFYYSTDSPQPGYSEQDPEIIWQAFKNCINEIAGKVPGGPIAICFSSAMHSLLVMDQKNSAITPLITWADTRSEKIAEGLRKSADAETLYNATGTPLHSMSPLCKIKWLKENDPGIFKKAFKFISIKEFIWYRLFGTYQIDYSIASATGLFNNKSLEWNPLSLQLCGITKDHLSGIVSTDFIRRDANTAIAKELHIAPGTSFCIGASDGCLANVGTYAMQKGIAALTIGTSGAVRIASSTQVINYRAMIFNYILDKKTFICGGPVNNGGNVVKWLFQTFLNVKDPREPDYDTLFKTIDTIPAGCEGLIFLPYVFGERAPVWNEKACGVFFGIKSHHTNAHFLRAVLEGICFALKSILEIIESSTNLMTQLNVSGGLVHSKTWMQMLADSTGKNISLQQTEDASSAGAALFYMKVVNIISDYASVIPPSNLMFKPAAANHLTYEKYYGVFKKLYEPLKASMDEIDELEKTGRD